jgi:serine phosphatase RsbU (regulator of sigma subunit)
MSRILVVEDDPAILRGLADNLRFESHEVLTAGDGEAGYRLIRERNPDLVILDVMLPGLNGFELCRKMRGEGCTTPILMLTAKSQEDDRVLGLDLGADEYVTKPFSLRELIARVRAIFRQAQERQVELKRFDQEMRIAAEVQQRLFPQRQPQLATLDFAGSCWPAGGVSGDTYDFLELAPGKLGMLLADVCGKGMSAALLMATVQACVRTHGTILGDRCDDVMARVNAMLYEATDCGRFVTMFYAVYDDASRRLIYSNAGHPSPLVIHRGAAAEWQQNHCTARASSEFCVRLDSSTPPLGIFSELAPSQQVIYLLPGDWLLIFSDGIPEAVDDAGQEFGADRIAEVVAQHEVGTAAEALGAVLRDVLQHCGGQPQRDDMTLIVAHVL